MAGRRRIARLRCSVQNYAWGRRGKDSQVGRLYSLQSKLPLDDHTPYAELWMGTHDSGPSFVVIEHEHRADGGDGIGFEGSNGVGEDGVNAPLGLDACDTGGTSEMLLKDWIASNPSFLGDKVRSKWGVDLPFLFKVLSVAKALSIQAHPDKHLAMQLHKLQPDIYKDDNHKPEMALAITKFEALCGFISLEELKHILETVPELQEVLGQPLSSSLMNISALDADAELAKSTLKEAFTTIMTTDKDKIQHALGHLNSRLLIESRSLTKKELLVTRLAKQYPGDVGVLSAFFFNYVELVPGQAIYLDANEPHAYLSGECLECMATSDNVVRAGLTPKYIDTNTLCEMLTYKQEMPEILSGVSVNNYIKKYQPPFDEFEMDSCIIPVGETLEFPSIQGPSIMIVLEGKGYLLEIHSDNETYSIPLQSGDIFFIPAETHFQLTANLADFHCYRAGINSRAL